MKLHFCLAVLVITAALVLETRGSSRRKPANVRRRPVKQPKYYTSNPSSTSSARYNRRTSDSPKRTSISSEVTTPPLPWRSSPSSAAETTGQSTPPLPTSQENTPNNTPSTTSSTTSSGASADTSDSSRVSETSSTTRTSSRSTTPQDYTGPTTEEKFYAFNSDTGTTGTYTPPAPGLSTDLYSGDSSTMSPDEPTTELVSEEPLTTETPRYSDKSSVPSSEKSTETNRPSSESVSDLTSTTGTPELVSVSELTEETPGFTEATGSESSERPTTTSSRTTSESRTTSKSQTTEQPCKRGKKRGPKGRCENKGKKNRDDYRGNGKGENRKKNNGRKNGNGKF